MVQTKFTEVEYQILKNEMKRNTFYLPMDMIDLVWSSYQRITQTNQPQPSTHPDNGLLWKKATQTIKDYIKANV